MDLSKLSREEMDMLRSKTTDDFAREIISVQPMPQLSAGEWEAISSAMEKIRDRGCLGHT